MQFLPFLTLNEGRDTHPHIVDLQSSFVSIIKIAPLNQFLLERYVCNIPLQ